MGRFVNDDVKIKNGGRNAVKITPTELEEKIIKRASNYQEIDCIETALSVLFSEDTSIIKDMKFFIDSENIYCNEKAFDEFNDIGTPLQGFHTLENGFTFLGATIGGDGELGAFVILYYDGKKIRCYTPSYGNTVNLDFKTAFGSECESEEDFSEIFSKYKKLGIVSDRVEPEEDDWTILYLRKYELLINNFKINWDAIKEDIYSRIVVM